MIAGAVRTTGGSPAITEAVEFGALGLGLALVCAALARLPSWFHALGSFQLLFAIGFIFYAIAVTRLQRYSRLPRVGLAVFAVAAACRVLLVPLPPSLSGDLFRYVWEGRVWLAGGNPYTFAPADPAFAMLRDRAIYPFVNHPELSAIYPPLAEAGFALVSAISPTVLAFKLWVAAHDLALVAVLLAWAHRARGSAAWALVYAWNPLMLVEYSGSGHSDPTAMLGLALAFLWREERPLLSATALAWGGLVKLAPLVALPFLWRHWPVRARVLCLALLLPALAWYAAETRTSVSGLGAYWSHWKNNELIFAVAERFLGGFGRARILTLGVVFALAAWAWHRRWHPRESARRVLGVAFLTSPVVHPWYAGWPLLFEIHGPSTPWLLLTALLALNYGFLFTPAEGRSFHAPLLWRWVEYGLPMLLAAGLAWRRRSRSGERVFRTGEGRDVS